MLLPSAIPFDSFHHPHQISAYSTSTPPPSSQAGFLSLSSCRALQAILGGRSASPLPPFLPIAPQQHKTNRPPTPVQSDQKRPPLRVVTQNEKITQREQIPVQSIESCAPHHRTNKRSRSEFEQVDENSCDGEKQRVPGDQRRTIPSLDRDSFSTPKRVRRVPLLMPLGLSAHDFAGLDATPEARQPAPHDQVKETLDFPGEADSGPEQDDDDHKSWSAADDRMLVSTVLDKLNLSCKQWNDCPRRLGKEADSLGKRWKALVGQDDVRLRRGNGARSRPELKRYWMSGGNA